MRIAHISDCYAPRTGGIETQVAELAAAQTARGSKVLVVTATPGPQIEGVVRTTMAMPFDLPIHLRTRARVVEVLREWGPDAVHVHAGVVSPFAWGAVRAARQLGLPTVVSVHGIWGPIAAPAFAASEILLRWSKWGVQIAAVSSAAARRISSAVPGAEPVLVVPNGIDAAAWRVRHIDGPPLRLVTVMRLAPRKRIIPLLRMVAAASARTPVELTVIGDGPALERARRHAQRMQAPVHIVGRLAAPAIREVFARSDAFIQPSVRESFGLAALEARCAGLPVIARSQTGTADFIHEGVEGLLARDDAGMSAAIEHLAEDDALRMRIAEHNAASPPEQDWPNVLATVDAAYAAARARAGI